MNAAEKLMLTMNDMLDQQSFRSITVTRICQQGQVSRPTFYHHYTSLADLTCNALYYRICHDVYPLKTWEDWLDHAHDMIIYMRDHRDYFKHVIDLPVKQAAVGYFDRMLHASVKTHLAEMHTKLSAEDEQFIAHIFSGIFVSLFSEYIDTGMTLDPGFLASQCSTLLDGAVERAIRGCMKS